MAENFVANPLADLPLPSDRSGLTPEVQQRLGEALELSARVFAQVMGMAARFDHLTKKLHLAGQLLSEFPAAPPMGFEDALADRINSLAETEKIALQASHQLQMFEQQCRAIQAIAREWSGI